MLQFVV